MTKGKENPNWRGGRSVDSQGYPTVLDSSGRHVREHRKIAEQILGRPLLSAEVVHHKNGDKSDNRPENLEITNQSLHMREHMTPDVARSKGLRGIESYRARRAAIKQGRQREISCACGCGMTRLLYDGSGRQCRYIKGHN